MWNYSTKFNRNPTSGFGDEDAEAVINIIFPLL